MDADKLPTAQSNIISGLPQSFICTQTIYLQSNIEDTIVPSMSKAKPSCKLKRADSNTTTNNGLFQELPSTQCYSSSEELKRPKPLYTFRPKENHPYSRYSPYSPQQHEHKHLAFQKLHLHTKLFIFFKSHEYIQDTIITCITKESSQVTNTPQQHKHLAPSKLPVPIKIHVSSSHPDTQQHLSIQNFPLTSQVRETYKFIHTTQLSSRN